MGAPERISWAPRFKLAAMFLSTGEIENFALVDAIAIHAFTEFEYDPANPLNALTRHLIPTVV